ncbi:MAG: ATP-dependent DNA helicase [Acidobacteria bacterium]|nr:ATP-dependent DNA helicase [Acidobacteriota bacterium]
MAVRVDLAGKSVVCSVHDLLSDPLRRSIGTPGEGLSRLTVGAELHRVVQARMQAADPHFTPEVSVDATLAVDGWTLRVIGRADGVSRPPDGPPVLEEIKTLHFRTELHHLFAEERLERYRWQARIYAAFLFPDGEASARLRLVDLGGERERTEEVPWSPREVHAYLRGRLHTMVAAERERERVRAVWRAAGEELPFPFDAPRPVQDEAIGAVLASLEAGRHLLLSAPTGVGKTAAALYPAVKLALATGRRVVFLTAKTLQQQLAVETLKRMQQGGWSSLQVRAKGRMCANDEVICHEEFCVFARDYGLKLDERGVLPALRTSAPHLDPDRVFEVAKAAEVCPFEVSLELIDGTTAIVCDYNYVFDPAIALFGLAESGSLEDTYLIVDEAHNLVDRAREYFSPRLSRRRVGEARRLLEGYRQKVCRDLDAVLDSLEQVIGDKVAKALEGKTGVDRVELEVAPLAAVRLELDALIAPFFTFKRDVELWLADDPVIDVLLSLARLVDLLEQEAPELVPLVERTADGDELLRLYCLDASRWVGAVLEGSAGCVAMSATLEPFEFYREVLGFDPDRTDTLALPSPFPPENRLVTVIEEVDTSYKQRSRHYGRIAELVGELAPPERNALVLFPSYAFLREVADRIHAPGHRVEIQRGEDSDAARRAILARLRGNHEPVLLLAVLGGVFAEGVDYPGEMLSEVIVVSPALPQVGPERELLKGYFNDRYERGFEYAYLVPGMTRVVQAAGRLIRSAEDRGAIVLVCKRFLREPYASLLPLDWTGGIPTTLRLDDPVAAVRAFFR